MVLRLPLLLGLLAPSAACFSTYQSATLVEPGAVSAGAALTHKRLSDDAIHAEILARMGVNESFELGFRWIILGALQNITLEPKVPIIRDTLAVALPVGFVLGDTAGLFQIHPTLIWSKRLAPTAELTAAGKLMLLFDNGERYRVTGANLGMRLSPNLKQWALHPELGLYRVAGGEGTAISLGVAFTGTIGGGSKDTP